MLCRRPDGSARRSTGGRRFCLGAQAGWGGVLIGLALLALMLPASAQERKFSVYTPQGTLSLFLAERNGQQYVSLSDAVGMLGDSSIKIDGRRWKLRFTPLRNKPVEAQFEQGKTRAKVRGRDLELAAPFLLEGQEGLVPVGSLPALVSALTGEPTELRQSSGRLFVGPVGTQFAASFEKGTPPRLLFHFPGPVTPSIATEPGHLRMVFTRDPLAGPAGTQNFDDKLITSAAYSEGNGVAEITVSGTTPLAASFTDGGKTIVITAAPAPRPPAPVSAAVPSTAAQPPQPAAPAPPRPLLPPEPRYAVVIDPGHGGAEPGAVLSPSLTEKDVTLAWARRLKAALDKRGISSLLLRDGDTTLSADQRAAAANGARPELFLSLHAGSTGAGVHVFTAQLAPSSPHPAGGLVPWDSAQAAYLDASRDLAGRVASALLKLDIIATRAPAMMRPLNNVTAPAIAIEVTPQQGKVDTLNDAAYQQAVCNAVVDAIASARSQLGALR